MGVPGGMGGDWRQAWLMNLLESSSRESVEFCWLRPSLSLKPWGLEALGPGRLPNRESEPLDHFSYGLLRPEEEARSAMEEPERREDS